MKTGCQFWSGIYSNYNLSFYWTWLQNAFSKHWLESRDALSFYIFCIVFVLKF